jgi:RNA polymerase sigma factor (sigma-70 family)
MGAPHRKIRIDVSDGAARSRSSSRRGRRGVPAVGSGREPSTLSLSLAVIAESNGLDPNIHESSSTSASLLKRIRSTDDHAAWREFVHRYWRLVWWFGRSAGLSEQDAEEVVQEVFIDVAKVAVSLEYEREKGRFRGMLQVIARRRIIDRFRKRRASAGNDAAFAHLEAGDSWKETWRRQELRAELLATLDLVARDVEPVTYQAFQLYVLEEWPVKKVASYLSISEDSVYTAKSRIIERLRQRVAHSRKDFHA